MEGLKQEILAEISRLLGKKPVNGDVGDEGGGPSSSSNDPWRQMEVSDKLEEFCLSTKKVELLAFDGKDPVGSLNFGGCSNPIGKTEHGGRDDSLVQPLA